MPPNPTREVILDHEEVFEKLVAPQATPIRFQYSYSNMAMFAFLHLAAAYGANLAFTEAWWLTILLAFFLHGVGQVGVCAGAHRLWSHRAYKAKLPLQILLMLMHSVASQYSAFQWARDHRLHHKFTDTDGDPHNTTRGLFFSHIGWLMVKKHPEAAKTMRKIDISDLKNNPVLRFQKKYSTTFIITIGFVVPTLIPMYFWEETFTVAWHINILRVMLSQHATFLINSAAHAFGNKPYDASTTPSQNVSVSIATLGEGWHNYHHVFPWDYRAAELGNNVLNWSTLFIDFFAWLGWAYDLKSVGNDVIARRAERTGDGTNLWGWGDKHMPKKHEDMAIVSHRKEE